MSSVASQPPDPFAGQVPRPQLPQLPPQASQGPSALSGLPPMAPVQAPAGPMGAGIEDPSSAVSTAAAHVADGMGTAAADTAGMGADMNIGDILAAVFGA